MFARFHIDWDEPIKCAWVRAYAHFDTSKNNCVHLFLDLGGNTGPPSKARPFDHEAPEVLVSRDGRDQYWFGN